MIDIAKEFQEKYHPCSKCFLNLCCSMKCQKANTYLIILQYAIEEYFSVHNVKFQFCISKLYYLNVSDMEAKNKMLLRPTKIVRRLSSQSEMFKMIVKDLIKRFENEM